MKALSIRQPWADLILYGVKDVENREWRAYTTGSIVVHAGKTYEHDAVREILETARDIYGPALYPMVAEIVRRAEERTGALLGMADIQVCVKKHHSPWFSGPNAMVMGQPLLFERPVPGRGRPGFFGIDDDFIRPHIHEGFRFKLDAPRYAEPTIKN